MKPDDVWKGLKEGEGRRVSASGKYDFFWSLLENKSPSLLLRLTNSIDDTIKLPKLRNIDVKFRMAESKLFSIKLLDETQREIFYTLCLDVVRAAEQSPNIEAALLRAVQRTRRWNFLLRSGGETGLSIDEQRGLIGELAYLRELSAILGPAAAIDAWKGPEGSSKDFELLGLCVEIKARRSAAKPQVSISSADQLSDVDYAKLFLRVYDVDTAIIPVGTTLHDHVNITAELFKEEHRSYERWLELIDAVGFDDADNYNERRWVLGQARSYEVFDAFPRICTPLTAGVENVRYTISLDSCEPYRCEEIQFPKY